MNAFSSLSSDSFFDLGDRERKKVPILVGICSAQGYAARRDAVRATWLTHPVEGIECVFFLGGPVPEEEQGRGDVLGLDAPDSYGSLPLKVGEFFRMALARYEFDWIFKCDDDTYLDLSRLPGLIDPEAGIIGDVLLERRRAPSGGSGYFLSHAVVREIVERGHVPPSGAEDLIFGRLALEAGAVPRSTPRLYLSNEKYPAPDNDQVSAHWCSPDLMKTLETLRHGVPESIYRAEHRHWRDEVLFYRDGVFRRRSTSCYGWWTLASDGVLTLRWKTWGEEQLVCEGALFVGGGFRLEPGDDSRPLRSLVPEACQTASARRFGPRPERLHLGGSRVLEGWLNLGRFGFDSGEILPWREGSILFYYLEEVAESLSPDQLRHFLKEAWRTLKPGGVLRLVVTDRVKLAAQAGPGYAYFRRDQAHVEHGPGWELEVLFGREGVRSYWTGESLAAFLQSAGFFVTGHEPGESDEPELRGLEKTEAGPQNPFELLGRVCLEARKPQNAPTLPRSALLSVENRQSDSPRKREGACVSPYFCSGSRTGNRLFQIAAVYAHALRQGLECRVPWRSVVEVSRLRDWLGGDAEVCPEGGYEGAVSYREPCFSHVPIPASVTSGRLNGYFQSERYFEDFEAEIRALYARLTSPRREGEAGVHIRMGDYLNLSHQFRSPDAAFLEEALGRISPSIRTLHLFSDNPGKALSLVRSLPAAGRFHLRVNEEDVLPALRSMSGMQELIMSCSSYSWWAAFLGKPEKVLVQKNWFAGVISDYQDVYRRDWIKL